MKKPKRKKRVVGLHNNKKIVKDEWKGLNYINGGNSDDTFRRMMSNLQ